jgi:hypothetical protein
MLRFKLILLGWLLINLTYGSEEFNCTLSKLKLNETNIECSAPGEFPIHQLNAKKFDKKSGNYTDRFVYKMNWVHEASVDIWDEKVHSWISSSDFKVNCPAETYMEPIGGMKKWYNANIKMSNIAPKGISTIIQ